MNPAERPPPHWPLARRAEPHPPELRGLLGEMAAAAVLMQANIKFKGALILQVFGDGPVKLAVAEAHPDLSFRATAKLVGEVPAGAQLEDALTRAVNMLGVGPQGLGGDSTAFAVHVETAATHITMNPVAVNMQCHSARRARATFTPGRIEYGF